MSDYLRSLASLSGFREAPASSTYVALPQPSRLQDLAPSLNEADSNEPKRGLQSLAMPEAEMDKTYEAKFLPMPPRRMPTPKPPEQNIPMPKMSPKKFLELARDIWLPFAFQGAYNGLNEAKEKVKEEANGIANEITYPEGLINETVKRKLYKY
jgi:hypothetical protein